MNSTQQVAREIRYESDGFLGVLQELGVSILVSTYEAGQLILLSNSGGPRSPAGSASIPELSVSCHRFEQAMGIAVRPQDITVASRGTIWELQSSPDIASQMSSKSTHDACFLARGAHVCDDIQLHEIGWGLSGLWLVNTRFSCLATLDEHYNFVPRWRPPFVTNLAPEDRCHLNGLAMANGRPAFVSMIAQTNEREGWRNHKSSGGCVMNVATSQNVVEGLSMPHSPRVYQSRLFVLDSGNGRLGVVENPGTDGQLMTVAKLPGYTRGLCFAGPYAFIGMSKIRDTVTFGEIPIANDPESLRCAVAVVDLRNGRRVAHLEFVEGMNEIFDVQIVRASHPCIVGPNRHLDSRGPIWAVPPPGAEPPLAEDAVETNDRAGVVLAESTLRDGKVQPESLHHFAEGFQHLNTADYVQAAEAFGAAARVSPSMADAFCNYGVALQLSSRFSESIDALNKAISLAPEMPAAHFNLSLTKLLMGDYEGGWPEYEWRWRCAQFGRKPSGIEELAPEWRGESLDAKTILVYSEQGIGDEVMFYSCLSDLIASAGKVLVSCEARLIATVRRSFPKAIVFEADRMSKPAWRNRLGDIDFQIAIGSLPMHFRKSEAAFPERRGYLKVESSLTEYWNSALPREKPRIGISWRGGLKTDQHSRSTNLLQWGPLFESLDATWVSLQYGEQQAEIAGAKAKLGVSILQPPRCEPLSELDDFFALIASLDAVVAVDNSNIHFAGALGVETLAMVAFPSTSHWRWKAEGESTGWYPTMQLVRKTPNNSWATVLENAASKLKEVLARRLMDDDSKAKADA